MNDKTNDKTIVENGEEMTVTRYQAKKLSNQKLIYYCRSCRVYHISDGKTWNDVDVEIEEQIGHC